MKNEMKMGKLFECESVVFKSGNIVGWNTLNKNVGQSATEEIELCLSSTIDKWLQKEADENSTTNTDVIVVDGCPQPPVKPEERNDMKITVKIFVKSNAQASVKEAVDTTLTEMGVSWVETVILSVTPTQSEASSHFDLIKPFWRELEEFVAQGKINSLGISDLNLEQLTALHDWAQVKPVTHQVNLTNCCTIPSEMTHFAKQHDLQLFTHSDPTEILPKSSIEKILESKITQSPVALTPSPIPPIPPKHLYLSWLSRYSVLIKCRGIIKSKGYLAKLIKHL